MTIYRRFGSYRTKEQPTSAEIAAMGKASEFIHEKEAKSTDDALTFARWWQDESISKDVKTFAIMAARVIVLARRCHSGKLLDDKIAIWADQAGISHADIAPEGRYASLMNSMVAVMQSGARGESTEESCAALKKYE